MQAYAVMDGGGVKGAALAGCLRAADDAGIEFIGFGGTSAGSIIAVLACVGFTGPRAQPGHDDGAEVE
jgi:NTE family protein